ncbi:glycosyl hydrolases family 16 [Klebsormidium nitens]|uniref:Glycosyl hydrolases family 16 n=1 Tax=Klebsormidium nitens TaxID=105231 RepID=A0A1Y1HUU7_KLENI|nr:glycosyl hydrolases family 16 [Klebsormidium nitens]|eukprot:GAQ82405.1 glycosyl hydrolases family 16 [Klebsormidium nitens]
MATAISTWNILPTFHALGAAVLLILVHSAEAQTILSTIDYSPQQVSTSGSTVAIRMDKSGGARVRTSKQYSYGTFSANIKCPAGDISGFVPAFYTSSLEGSGNQDEIDVEFLGKNKGAIQTNYYVNGQGGREQMISLGFDCSSAFHKYTIQWTSSSIKWFVDDKLVRTATNDGSSPYPTKPSYLYASIWDASSVNGGAWAGTATYANAPYSFQLQGISAS